MRLARVTRTVPADVGGVRRAYVTPAGDPAVELGPLEVIGGGAELINGQRVILGDVDGAGTIVIGALS